jgi:polysaccharide biosynthesis transport protein
LAEAEDTLSPLGDETLTEPHNPISQDVLRALRRRRGLIILCTILIPLAALGLSLAQDKQWKASASLLFRDPQFAQQLFGSMFSSNSNDPQRAAATNLDLVSSEEVANRAARRLGGISPEALTKKINLLSESQSDVVTIEAIDKSARRATEIANVVASEYVAFRREADQGKVRSAQALVQAKLAALPPEDRAGRLGDTLRDRSSELDVLSSLQTGNAELVHRATPPQSPYAPRPLRNTVIGIALGLLLGVGLALLLDRLDRRLRDRAEIEELFGRPVLGTVPMSASLVRRNVRELPPQVSEAFRMLRANLRYFNIKQNIKSVLITSAGAGEGKSTVAIGLAMAAASAGTKTLLLELDLRRPTIGKKLGLEGGEGVSLALAQGLALDRAVTHVSLKPGMNGGSEQLLDVALAGPLPPNPNDLLESEQMADLIREAEREYELVVVDTPPASLISDAIPLVKKVTGVLVVTRLGMTTREGAIRLRDQLRNLDAPPLGIIVNATRTTGDYYAYTYPQSEIAVTERSPAPAV